MSRTASDHSVRQGSRRRGGARRSRPAPHAGSKLFIFHNASLILFIFADCKIFKFFEILNF